MLLEPLISVIIIGLLLGPLVGRTAPDMPYAFFLLNGFILLQTFTGTMTSGLNAINANSGLLVFPKVQPLDILLARFIFELLLAIGAFVIFSIAGMWFGVQLSLGHLHILVAAFLVTWLFGCGFGLMLSVGAAYFQSMDKVMAFVRRPLLFMSCVLYPLYNLPMAARQALLHNPLVHTIELSRKSLFPLYHVGEVNLRYPAACAVVAFAIGICLFHNKRHFLTQR